MSRLKLPLCLCFLLLNLAVSGSVENDNEILFKNGRVFLLSGNYIKALHNFELLTKKGLSTSELYCNLGDVYYKTGFPGKAVFYYEKGLLLSPFDAELMYNKNAVNTQLNLRGLDDNAPYLTNHLPLLNIVDDGIKLSIILFMVSSLLFVALSLNAFNKWKSAYKIICKYSLLFAVLFFVVLSGLMIHDQSISYAIVLDKNAEVKTGPGNLAKNIFILNEGEKVEIEKYYSGWYKIKRYNNTEGWINSLEIGLIE